MAGGGEWRGAHTVDADPRIDPRQKAAMKAMPADGVAMGDRDKVFASREEMLEWNRRRAPEMMKAMLEAAKRAPPPPPEARVLWDKKGLDITKREFVSQPDGNKIKLNVVRPKAAAGPLPLVYYIHGGGMAVGSAFDPMYIVWARVLANQGVATAFVDFRNCLMPSLSNPKVAPYPAGLNDCYSGLLWCHSHAAELGADPAKITVAGESGGGNLAIATVLKAKREGKVGLVSGLYALCPYIAGTWPADVTHNGVLGDSHLPKNNNGYFITLTGTRDTSDGAMGYGIDAFRSRDPLAWPGFASIDELRGLPRSVISVNECDPLRDEGVLFYRKCLQAGVTAQCRQVMGTVHGGDLMVATTPDIALETARSIAHFARGFPGAAAKM